MILLEGQTLAAKIRNEVKEKIKKLGLKPGLSVILVGEDPASHLYVKLKERACAEVGIRFEKYLFPSQTPQAEIIKKIQTLNWRPEIQAILVQVPLPPPLSEEKILAALDPRKDVDGFHPKNLELLLAGQPFIIPGVAQGIMTLLKSSGQSLIGKQAALLVNSFTFAAPLRYLLEKEGAHPHLILAPKNLETITPQLASAEILITAIGQPRAITRSMIRDGSLIIDLGTNRLNDGRVVGDVDFETIKEKAGACSPVPGGVGPLTVAMLIRQTFRLASRATTADQKSGQAAHEQSLERA